MGCLMYAVSGCRPDVALPVNKLCQVLHKPTPELMNDALLVVSYLARTADLGITYAAGSHSLEGYADASWEVKHSTSGWHVIWQKGAIAWGSQKQKSIALSSCEAEIIALSEAAKDMVYFRKLVAGVTGVAASGPSSLSSDSQSARDVSYNPEHHNRMKHVERRHFFVRDMVEKGELLVPFVPTASNYADFFTKTLKNATHFTAFRNKIMNIVPDAKST